MPWHCTAILYDGHTLGLVIADLEKACRGCRPRHPRRHGYRAHNYPDRFKVCITGQIRRVTTLTWDRGKELADHRRFTLATNIEVYFCDPQCPGSAGPMRTPMVYSSSTFRAGPTCRCILKLI